MFDGATGSRNPILAQPPAWGVNAHALFSELTARTNPWTPVAVCPYSASVAVPCWVAQSEHRLSSSLVSSTCRSVDYAPSCRALLACSPAHAHHTKLHPCYHSVYLLNFQLVNGLKIRAELDFPDILWYAKGESMGRKFLLSLEQLNVQICKAYATACQASSHLVTLVLRS